MVDGITREDLERLNDKLDDIRDRLTRVEGKQMSPEERAASCPQRVDIARAQNNIVRLQRVEICAEENREAIHSLRRNWARLAGIGVASGLIGGGLGQFIAQAITGALP